MASLPELFEHYRLENTDAEWRAQYAAACVEMAAVREGREALSPELVRRAWVARDWGPAYVSQGCVSAAEYPRFAPLVTEITRKILADPGPATLDEVYALLRQAKEDREIAWMPRVMTHRIFAAAAPDVYSSVVYVKHYRALYRLLRERHGLIFPVKGNWAATDGAMRAAVAAALPGADPYLLNTFIWHLAHVVAAEAERAEREAPDAAPPEAGPDIPFPPALNTIYYGPPGTGKTHVALSMLRAHFTARVRLSETLWEESLVREALWREVVAAALCDFPQGATVPELRRHPLIAAKRRDLPGGPESGKTRRRRADALLWATLQAHTPAEVPPGRAAGKHPPALFDITSRGSVWQLLPGWEENMPEAGELVERYRRGRPEELREERRYEIVTFHQSYSYEEFVEGIRPVLDNDAPEDAGDGPVYALRDGIFKRLCARARKDPDHPYALLIDEINRGNISKIFGELITLLEASRRARGGPASGDGLAVRLPYSGEAFSIPANLYLIGTMNTADRSLAFMDTALRRRFAFVRLDPEPELLRGREVEGVRLDRLLATLNRRLEALCDREHVLGHAFFLPVTDLPALEGVFRNAVLPLLEEYFFDDWEKIRLVLGDNRKQAGRREDLCFLRKTLSGEALFGEDARDMACLPVWRCAEEALRNPEAYKAIYQPPDAEAGE